MSVGKNELIEKQKQLQHRAAQQQGRLADVQQRYEQTKEAVQAAFGTTDMQQLRGIYKDRLEHRKQALAMRNQLNELVEQALAMIEQGQPCPPELVNDIQTKTEAFHQHVASAQASSSDEVNSTMGPTTSAARDHHPSRMEHESAVDKAPIKKENTQRLPVHQQQSVSAGTGDSFANTQPYTL